jgi:hybrid cluster-associated redox disulfide protein
MHEMVITPDLLMGEILTKWPETLPVFIHYRMTCIGCYMSPFDTLEDALIVHSLPLDEILIALNQRVAENLALDME